jgi:hypothetical protein
MDPIASQCSNFWRVDSSMISAAKRSTSATLRSPLARFAAQFSARANACISLTAGRDRRPTALRHDHLALPPPPDDPLQRQAALQETDAPGDTPICRASSALTRALCTEPPQAARSACQSLVFPCVSRHNAAIYWRTRDHNLLKYSYRDAREA